MTPKRNDSSAAPPQHRAVRGVDAHRRPRLAALDRGRGIPVDPGQVLPKDTLDGVRVVRLDVDRADVRGRRRRRSQLVDADAHDLRALLEAEALVERDRGRVARVDVEDDVRGAVLAAASAARRKSSPPIPRPRAFDSTQRSDT